MRVSPAVHVSSWRWALAALVMVPPACHELYFSDNDEVVSAHLAPAECAVDADCTLMPAAITCCGECEPVPPFESVPRHVVDALLLESENACAPRTRLCEPPACAALPERCAARAVCRTGRCTVVESGCGVRVGER